MSRRAAATPRAPRTGRLAPFTTSDRTSYASTIDLRTRETVERLTWYNDMAGEADEEARWQALREELQGGGVP